MDAITNMIFSGITEFNEMNMFIVICRLMVIALVVETFGVICGHFASLGRS